MASSVALFYDGSDVQFRAILDLLKVSPAYQPIPSFACQISPNYIKLN